jgi:hypothetical protein
MLPREPVELKPVDDMAKKWVARYGPVMAHPSSINFVDEAGLPPEEDAPVVSRYQAQAMVQHLRHTVTDNLVTMHDVIAALHSAGLKIEGFTE